MGAGIDPIPNSVWTSCRRCTRVTTEGTCFAAHVRATTVTQPARRVHAVHGFAHHVSASFHLRRTP